MQKTKSYEYLVSDTFYLFLTALERSLFDGGTMQQVAMMLETKIVQVSDKKELRRFVLEQLVTSLTAEQVKHVGEHTNRHGAYAFLGYSLHSQQPRVEADYAPLFHASHKTETEVEPERKERDDREDDYLVA